MVGYSTDLTQIFILLITTQHDKQTYHDTPFMILKESGIHEKQHFTKKHNTNTSRKNNTFE